jgi:ribosomal protein S27E
MRAGLSREQAVLATPKTASPLGVAMGPSVMHLQCPACREEELFIGLPRFDQRITCGGCGATPEVRHAHESWCATRRGELLRRFPDLIRDEPPIGGA